MTRFASRALLVAVLSFVVLFAVASRAYPGGTHFDHRAVGHDFWRNTLCDVARTIALDGSPNRVGCAFARAALTILAFGLGLFFVLLPRSFPSRRRSGAAVRALGAAASMLAVAVVFMPSDRFGALHGIVIVLAGIPGLTAAVLAVHGLLREPHAPRAVVALGAVTLAVAGADFGLYVAELASGGAAQLAVSVLERVATILLLTWMVTVARALSPPAQPAAHGRALRCTLTFLRAGTRARRKGRAGARPRAGG